MSLAALAGLSLAGLVAAAAAMAGAFVLRRATGRSGFIDVTWTFSTGVIGAALAAYAGAGSLRSLVVAGAALLWAGRLGAHLLVRTLHSPDDPRYVKLETEWGARAGLRLFLFLQSQAVVAALLAIAIALAGAAGPSPWRDALALATLLVALGGEALADRQLEAFKADPGNRGRICDVGLWGRSRHPNYFFEWLVWVAFALAAADFAQPASALAWLAPAAMYWALRYVSGVPMVEDRMAASRPEAFARYCARTPIFFPRLG